MPCIVSFVYLVSYCPATKFPFSAMQSRSGSALQKLDCGNGTVGAQFFWFMVKFSIVACTMVVATICLGQNPLNNALTMAMGDVAAIKQMAESGDATAQIKVADLLVSKHRAAE